MVEDATSERRVLQRAAQLSFAAAAVTSGMTVWSWASTDAFVHRWLLVISLPAILASVVQGVQYRRGHNTNAFYAVAVYLFFIVVYLTRALGLYFFGVILQGLAWAIGRNTRS